MDIHQGVKEHILMLKQKKKQNLKIYSRFRKLLKNNKTGINPILLLALQKLPKYEITLRVTQNNVFCTLLNYSTKNIIFNTSSGKEKLNISRKTLIFGSKNIITSFLRKVKKKLAKSKVIINITSPYRIKVLFLRLLKTHTKKSFLVIKTNPKKCFNGCKPAKKKRKKQRGLRVFK